jgi:hypothetical protein
MQTVPILDYKSKKGELFICISLDYFSFKKNQYGR